MVQFLSINFFSWISSIFVGFFKSSRFFVSPCTYRYHLLWISLCLVLSLLSYDSYFLFFITFIFYVLLTVHLGIILVNNQLYAQFFSVCVYFDTLHVSSIQVLIIRRIKYINTTSDIFQSM